MDQFIKVIIKEPMKPAVTSVVKNTLNAFRQLVGGYIEAIRLRGCIMLVNEDGKLRGLTANLACGADLIVGTAVFVGESAGEFSDCELTWREISKQVTDLWSVEGQDE